MDSSKKEILPESMSDELKVELEVLENLINFKNSSFSGKPLRQVQRLPLCIEVAPCASQSEFEMNSVLFEIFEKLDKLPSERQHLVASSGFAVRLVSFLTSDDPSINDVIRLREDVKELCKTGDEEIKLPNTSEITPFLYTLMLSNESKRKSFSRFDHLCSAIPVIAAALEIERSINRSALHRGLIQSDFAISTLAKNCFGTFSFLKSIVETPKMGEFGISSCISIGDFSRVKKLFETTVAASWRNPTATSATIEKIEKTNLENLLKNINFLDSVESCSSGPIPGRMAKLIGAILIHLRDFPTVDPVVKDQLKFATVGAVCQTFHDEIKAFEWLVDIDGIRDHNRYGDLTEKFEKMQNTYEKLGKRQGLRKDHDEYVEMQRHVTQFIRNQIEPFMRKKLEKSSRADLEQLISVSLGFRNLIETFHWYPDITSVFSILTTELIFALRVFIARSNAQIEKFDEKSEISENDPTSTLLDKFYERLILAKNCKYSEKSKEQILDLLALVCKKWDERKTEIQKEKEEEAAQFKMKNLDLGETVEEQLAKEEAEFEQFFMVKNEFKSETDGPEIQDETNSKKVALVEFEKFAEIFLEYKEKSDVELAQKVNNLRVNSIIKCLNFDLEIPTDQAWISKLP